MCNIKEDIRAFINKREVLILGFGKEGRSTYKMLRSYFKDLEICISDINTDIASEKALQNDPFLGWVLGEGHMKALASYSLVFKSPGITFKNYRIPHSQQISSQTDLFIELFHNQIIGVTGTKGKSTTVSLINHLLVSAGKKVLLVGNIGIPAFEVLSQIDSETLIIYELSSHQLEFTTHSPHIAVFLNLFEEHLDHYRSYLDYQKSKGNITNYQGIDDYLIYNLDDNLVCKRILESGTEAELRAFSTKEDQASLYSPKNNELIIGTERFEFDFSKTALLGDHNILNILSALGVCQSLNVDLSIAIGHLYQFKPLPHRLEDLGSFRGIRFINDSIATIPEACINAISTFPDLDILVLGGFDRGIDYSELIDFLLERKIPNIILMGQVGRLLKELFEEENYSLALFEATTMEEVIQTVYRVGKEGSVCLLSPAASSYDAFHNFEDRGDQYKKKVIDLA